MNVALHALSRDPRTRYDGGFDRWDHNSRQGWTVLWRASEYAEFALGEENSIWVWDDKDHIWSTLPADEQSVVLREHQMTLRQLRRAVPILRLFLDGSVDTEREAARAALHRIGTAIVGIWQQGKVADQLRRGQGWIDHPAALYQAVARDCRLQFNPPVDFKFEPTIFAALAAQTEEDFRAGRREHPPRLRPQDLANLQTAVRARFPARQAEDVDGEAEDVAAPQAPGSEAPDTARAGFDPTHLRHAMAEEIAEADRTAATRFSRRRYLLMASGMAAAFFGAFVIFGGLG
jgi:hypothetical protein